MPERVEEPFVFWGCKLFEKGFEETVGMDVGGPGGAFMFCGTAWVAGLYSTCCFLWYEASRGKVDIVLRKCVKIDDMDTSAQAGKVPCGEMYCNELQEDAEGGRNEIGSDGGNIEKERVRNRVTGFL